MDDPLAEQYDFIFKVVIIGDSGVGKSNLITRMAKNTFTDTIRPTIGVEFFWKDFMIGDEMVKVVVWDTAGQEKFRAISSCYFRSAVAAGIVYDITKKESFESVERWLDDLRNYSSPSIIIILIGNKTDEESERVISKAEGENLAKKHKLLFMETSAKNGSNVEKAFEILVTEVLETYNKLAEIVDEEVGNDSPNPISRNTNTTQNTVVVVPNNTQNANVSQNQRGGGCC
eukprot:TRINITY_DN3591_c0_g1_i1.p2 TRINITY_DN3591_c0_g1~~TRINITY_DN3591_c0_g1_i1.p2  ORF type:complete len:230 (-),score=64.41 TRINITY_DN3591_c0_g1_i1:47-736(-)